MPSYEDNDRNPRGNWTTMTSSEAREVTQHSEYFDDSRRQSERTTQAVDAALNGVDWNRVVPPGEDPRTYINAMVSKSGGSFGSDYIDSSKVTQALPAPTSLSMRTPWGFPRAATDAQPGDVLSINIGGKPVDVEVEQAVREGLIRRSAGGGYEPLSSQERQASTDQAHREQQEQKAIEASGLEAKRATGDEPDSDTTALIGAINARVPAPAIEALVNDMVSSGTLSLDNVVRVGQAAGLSSGQATTWATRAVEGFQRQANAAAMSVGIAAEELGDVHEWALQHMPFEYANAQRSLAFASDARGIKDIASRYRAWKHMQQQR